MKTHIYTMIYLRRYLLSTLFFFLLLVNDLCCAGTKEIIGNAETIRILHYDITAKARIDTGAKFTSINVTDPLIIKKEKGTWVVFTFTNSHGDSVTIEKPIIKFITIKRKNANAQARPVILIDICLGNIVKQEEVNLVDRSSFEYQVLIGRSFLHNNYLVDVDRSFTIEPSCNAK